MIIDISLLKDKINTATENKTVAVFNNLFKDTPSWQDFIDHLTFAYFNPPMQVTNNPEKEVLVNGVAILDNFYIRNRVHPETNYLYQNKNVIDIFDKVFEYEGELTASYINFVGNITPLNIHKDERDMVYWQCIGKSEWYVYPNGSDNEPEIHVLNPGDILVSPAGTVHAVVTDSPRAALVFAYKEP